MLLMKISFETMLNVFNSFCVFFGEGIFTSFTTRQELTSNFSFKTCWNSLLILDEIYDDVHSHFKKKEAEM